MVLCFEGTTSANMGPFEAVEFQLIVSPISLCHSKCVVATHRLRDNLKKEPWEWDAHNSTKLRTHDTPWMRIRPEWGYAWDILSATTPPKKDPIAHPAVKRLTSAAALLWSKPASSVQVYRIDTMDNHELQNMKCRLLTN